MPNLRSKLLWFYQEVDEPEVAPVPDINKPGPSRAAVSNTSKTPQGKIFNTKSHKESVALLQSNPKMIRLLLSYGFGWFIVHTIMYVHNL